MRLTCSSVLFWLMYLFFFRYAIITAFSGLFNIDVCHTHHISICIDTYTRSDMHLHINVKCNTCMCAILIISLSFLFGRPIAIKTIFMST